MKAYSPDWKASKKPAKQRKYRENAPVHIKRKFMAAPLAKNLRETQKTKATIVRVGDKVKVLRGSHKGKTGTVERVDVRHERIFITGIDQEKKDGSKAMVPIHPSNLLIETLNTQDKRRFGKPKSEKKAAPKKATKKAAKTEKKEDKQ